MPQRQTDSNNLGNFTNIPGGRRGEDNDVTEMCGHFYKSWKLVVTLVTRLIISFSSYFFLDIRRKRDNFGFVFLSFFSQLLGGLKRGGIVDRCVGEGERPRN